MLKKRFGLKRVYEDGVLKYKVKWWLYYVPSWIIKKIIKE